MKTEEICPNCKKTNIKKDGKRKTQNRGLIQRYKCRDCNKRFVVNDGFFRMRNNPQKITCALDLFFKGVSTRNVQEHFKAFYPHNSSHKSIYKWVVKYSKQISNFTDTLKVNTGNEIEIDEMEYKRRKHHRKTGVDKNWFIDVVDLKTRFMISSNYVKNRSLNELKSVLKKAKNKTGNQIEIVTSDGLLAYPKAVRSSFTIKSKNITRKYGVSHKIVNASRGEGFNHKIERLHNSVRQLTQNFRGFHGCLESANSIMKGYEINYNFIRKHQAIKKCPYELATDLKLNSENKWLELIGLSCIIDTHHSN